ncbi:LysR family transcriptional regulator [Microvirga pakistanensis]|uniref:LysR family transcriptional regulator n=1 Tax=Microvirga pakistanensis TaxID=1682650 RepID=UPI00106CE7AE|nr:LysR family transcriptional regulator [Microvirga pakistanensis]
MDRLQAMTVFVAVAEEEGFAPAARRLAMSPPAVTRAIAAIEQRIGTRLLHRTTRNVRLTEAGARYFEDCRRILAEIEEAEETAAGAHREPRGQLSITASVLFGRMYVAPILLDFIDCYPQVSARTLFVDRVVNLMEEGLDVAVRIAHLPDSGMTALRVGSVRRVICASPDYLAEHGIPQEPGDLARHRTIAFQGVSPSLEWSFQNDAAEIRVRPSPRLVVNTAEMAITAALQGHGLTQVLSYMVAPELAAGRLKIVLAEFEAAPIPIHLVHQEGRRVSGRVRAFMDFAAGRLRADMSIN